MERPSPSHEQGFKAAEALVPEVGQNRERIQAAVSEMLARFEIKNSVLDDPARALLLCGLAEKWDTDEGQRYAADVLSLIADQHSHALETRFVDEAHQAGEHVNNSEGLEATIDSFTNRPITEALKGAFDHGMLEGVRERLGVSKETEDEFEIRVLNIAGHNGDFTEFSPGKYPMYDALDVEGWKEADAEWQQDKRQIDAWQKGLTERGQQYMKQAGMKSMPAAWVTTLDDGRRIMCLKLTTAELLLESALPEEERMFSQSEIAKATAVVEHEYTHTQSRATEGQQAYMGLNIEELRAEHFSGNTAGYLDAKGFFADIKAVTGFDMTERFDERQRGGSVAELLADLANATSLSTMVEIAGLQPVAYRGANPMFERMYEAVGGYDGVLARLLEQQIAAGHAAEVEDRITDRAQRILQLGPLDKVGYLEDWRKRQHDLHVVTELVFEKARHIEKAGEK